MGESDFVIERIGSSVTVTVSVAVGGLVIPVPLTVTVLVISEPEAGGANELTRAS